MIEPETRGRINLISNEPKDDLVRLQNELTQRQAELDILTSVQLGLANHLESQAIYDLVGDKIREFFDPDVVMISTYDRETNTVEHRYAIEVGERIYAPGHLPPGGFRSQVIQNMQPLLVNTDVAEKARLLGQPTIPGTVTPKSWLGVPMLVTGQVTGILSLQSITTENAFDDSDVRILQSLAASMSVALENARLWEKEHLYRKALEREFEIGRKIQAGFLPQVLPQPNGWEIAACLKPAREVAGDFYDVFKISDRQIGLVIADVCDKGLGAALFMTLVRSLLRAVSNLDSYASIRSRQKLSSEKRLLQAARLTNNYLEKNHGTTGNFSTVFFGILDTHNGSMKYINCGHIPPIVIDSEGKMISLTLTGMAIGAMHDADYRVSEVELRPGDLFFAYTDGLTDAEDRSGESFGMKRLSQLLLSKLTPMGLVKHITCEVEGFLSGAAQFDDIAILTVMNLV